MASCNFVSRGGDKLQAALDRFNIDVVEKVALDVGSSTGGFVDCLLQKGAAKVYAVDTAYGEFAWKLRNDPRVVVMERTNILHLESLPEQVDLITIDAGWTKLELILPIVQKFLKPDGRIIALLKPHYEANQRDLVKGVLPPEIAEEVRKQASEKFESLYFKVEDVMESPILGGAGNKEYLLSLLFLKKDQIDEGQDSHRVN
jgi:23S rRNA (cytidine1920-2'-O)/16S rRNA (cytidine1409-2'-O)-methyltransferase